MVLVSFFSEGYVLSEEIKIYALFFNIKVTNIKHLVLFGHPVQWNLVIKRSDIT